MSEKDSKNWKQIIWKETNVDIDKTMFRKWSWEKMQFIFRESWWNILDYCRENDLTLNNIVAITGKDTRKTTVWIIFLWFLMNQFPFLNGFLLRDTIIKSKTQMKQQLRKAVNLITTEYGVIGFDKAAYESNDGFYLTRLINSKNNQKVELMSFDSIIELGGFTTNNGGPAIFIYDELQNPQSKNKKIINPKQFMANYKFIAEKNEAIELSTKQTLPKWIPRHIFLSNRYVGHHPLNLFAEAHFPYYESWDENKKKVGVREWMLQDPLKNNFVAKYFGKNDMVDFETQDEKDLWKDFWGTMIIYASKLSNTLLLAEKNWKKRQIELIERGNADDLARVIGDLFEGYDNDLSAYHYTERTKISLDEFKKEYAKYVYRIRISIDLDYHRQIVMGLFYDVRKDKMQIPIFRTIRDFRKIIKCHGVSNNGAKTEQYIKQIHNAILEYVTHVESVIPHYFRITIIIDDKKGNVVSRFNFGDFKDSRYFAIKVSFDQIWKVQDRPKVIDEMQDTKFLIDIDHPSINFLHQAYKIAKIKSETEKKPPRRLELASDPMVDHYNQDEYGLYNSRPNFVFNNIATKRLLMLGVPNEW